jgi:addiction module RelE/StbE family toxin
VRLQWSIFAQTDRNAIFEYIEADSPQAAITVDDRIRAQVSRLARYPQSGRPGRVAGTRELVIHRTPYIAAYRIAGDTVRILRVLHGAQPWPRRREDMSEEPKE